MIWSAHPWYDNRDARSPHALQYLAVHSPSLASGLPNDCLSLHLCFCRQRVGSHLTACIQEAYAWGLVG